MGLFRGHSSHPDAELSLGSTKWSCTPPAQGQSKDTLMGVQLGGILILPRFYLPLQGTGFCSIICKDFINYSSQHRSQSKTWLLGLERLVIVLVVLISS